MSSETDSPHAPHTTTRRNFLAALLGMPLVSACDKATKPATGFDSPIPDEFRFVRQIPDGSRLENDTSFKKFRDVAPLLDGQPFTLSFITSLCSSPVEGRDMLCDKMAKALAAVSKSNPATKHVVISALPGADYYGGLWGALHSKGLSPDNTIILFPTENGKVDGMPLDGKLVAKIQNNLQLPNDSATNFSAHSAAISYYSGAGKLCGIRQWREAINSPSMPEECRSR